MTDWNFHSTFWIYTVSYRKNTVSSAMNIQYTWLRKIDNFLLYIIYIYYLSIHYFKKKWFNVLKLKTHNESNIRFKTIFNIFAFVSKNGAKIVSFIKKKKQIYFHVPILRKRHQPTSRDTFVILNPLVTQAEIMILAKSLS